MISEVVLLKPKAKCMMSQDSRKAQNKEQFPMKATLVAVSDEIQHKNVATGAAVNKATKASIFKPFGAHIRVTNILTARQKAIESYVLPSQLLHCFQYVSPPTLLLLYFICFASWHVFRRNLR